MSTAPHGPAFNLFITCLKHINNINKHVCHHIFLYFKFFILSKAYFLISSTACLILISLIITKFYSTVVIPFVEARELANIIAIESFQAGIFHNLNYYPENIYLYGPLQAWLLSFLPQNTDFLIANRAASFGFLLLSIIPLFRVIKHFGINLTPNVYILAFTAYLIPFFFQTPITHGTPNYLGLLFSNLTLLYCVKRNKTALFIIPICLVCCIMTKQYFLFAYSYVICSLLILKWKQNHLISFLVISAATFLGGFLYFSSPQGQYALQHHLNVRHNTPFLTGIIILIQKSIAYIVFVSPLICLIILAHFKKHFSCELTLSKNALKTTIKQNTGSYDTNKLPNILFSFAILACSLIVILRLGQHRGAIGFLYFSQIITPSLLVFSLGKFYKLIAC